MNKIIVISAAVLACLSVIFGAFGAHTLKDIVQPESLITFETGVRYQMYHALALLFIGLSTVIKNSLKKTIFIFFLTGVILFSGSIYLLSLKEIILFDVTKIAFITPLGGVCFIIGWVVFIVGLIKLK